MQRDMSYWMLATFADSFRGNPMAAEMDRIEAEAGGARHHANYQGVDLAQMPPEQMEQVLADTVLKEFKIRLARIGIEYQTPQRAA
jgi:hypothetical protein